MGWLPPLLISLLIISGWVYMFRRQNGARAKNAPLRGEIEAQVCFETSLDRARVLGTGGFGGTRGYWISLRGPKRLTVGTDAFMVPRPRPSVSLYSQAAKLPLHSVKRRPAWVAVTG
jgi:hypothetical protein